MKTYKLNINGTKYSVDIKEVEGQEINLEVNGTPYKVTVDKEMKPTKVAAPKVVSKAATQATAGVVPPAAKAKAATVNSPLPGPILKIFVKEGDKVTAGQKVVLLEAMKMENNIETDYAGTVTSIKVREGDSIMEGDVLITIGE